MIAESFRVPFADEGWIKTVLVGSVLSLLGFLIVPALLVNGYLLRVLGAGAASESELPGFDDWGGLLVDGLKLVAVVFAYVLGALFLGFVGSIAIAAVGSAVGAGEAARLLTFLFGLPLLLVAAYLLPAALTNVARTGRVAGAFDVGVLRQAATSSSYLVAVLASAVIAVTLGTIASLLTLVLVGVAVAFYLQLVVYYLLGRGVGEAVAVERSEVDTQPV